MTIAILIPALSLSLQLEIEPVAFKSFNVSGGLGTAELRFPALSGRQITTTIEIPIPAATP